MKLADITKALIVSAVFTWPCVLFAQNYDDPGLGEKPVSAHPQDYKPLGIRAGSFMLHPGVQLAAEFTDNVFYTGDAAVFYMCPEQATTPAVMGRAADSYDFFFMHSHNTIKSIHFVSRDALTWVSMFCLYPA